MSRETSVEIKDWLDEGSTWYTTLQLTDERGLNLNSGSVATVALTWYERDSGQDAPVNGLLNEDVKNLSRGTLSSVGLLELRLTPDDMVILQANRQLESRCLKLRWTFGPGGTRVKQHERFVVVRNLRKTS